MYMVDVPYTSKVTIYMGKVSHVHGVVYFHLSEVTNINCFLACPLRRISVQAHAKHNCSVSWRTTRLSVADALSLPWPSAWPGRVDLLLVPRRALSAVFALIVPLPGMLVPTTV